MLIRRLVLENYGLFAGRQEFDLVPRVKYGKTRPIILFGGKNGAGKTTILEAIRLVLYGRLVLGNRVRAIDYDKFLRDRVHRQRLDVDTNTKAAIAIEFDHVHRGVNDRFLVERSWNASGNAVSEDLSVLRNGKQLDDVDAEFWQSFVRDIIPEGLSQLFFFDGEKIRELAEDTTGSAVLADSIKSLLGLDLVERLDADLSVYTGREIAKLGAEDDRARMTQLDREVLAFELQVTECEEQLATNRTRQDGMHAEIRKAEEELRRDGENLASRRTRLQADKVQLTAQIEAVEKALRAECETTFPLALCPRTRGILRKQLTLEQDAAHEPHVRSAMENLKQDLLKSLGDRSLGLHRAALKNVRALVLSAITSRLEKRPAETGKVVHHLSDSDQRKTLGWLTDGTKSKSRVTQQCEELAKHRLRLEHAERNLAQIPSDEAVKPRVETLNELNKRLGGLEQSRTEIDEKLKRFRIDLESRQRERRNLGDKYRGGEQTGKRIYLAKNVQAALKDYLHELTQLKVAQLRETVAQCFNRLCRKGDVVKRIEIDARSFAVNLYDQQGRAVPKEDLSSGEKQIFAIAMLWGLAQTSGRPLPVIIDTPLGRLDSDHRRNLIEEYFPHASHQVVLLSTDTEVDQSLFEQLSPTVSHAYQLLYLGGEGRTEVSDGYFWKRMVHA